MLCQRAATPSRYTDADLQYDFLAHAILGHAASHLTQTTDKDFSAQALIHRVTAMQLVNKELSKPTNTSNQQEAEVIFATLLVLANQAAYLPDAMLEFVTMFRGCNIVQNIVVSRFKGSVYSTFTPQEYVTRMQRIVRAHNIGPAESVVVNKFLDSVGKLESRCTGPVERNYHAALEKVARVVGHSSVDGR